MKYFFTLSILFLLQSFNISAQTQNPFWYFPPNVVNFNTGVVSPLPNSITKSDAANGINSTSGDIDFYITSGSYVNRNGNKYNSAPAFSSGIPIIPVPGECNSYYDMGITWIVGSGSSDNSVIVFKKTQVGSTGNLNTSLSSYHTLGNISTSFAVSKSYVDPNTNAVVCKLYANAGHTIKVYELSSPLGYSDIQLDEVITPPYTRESNETELSIP